MEIKFTNKAQKQYANLPHTIQKKVDKQIVFLLQDHRHPSLNAKKYSTATGDLWQARIDKSYRLYFFIENPHYIVVSVINHPK
ncbi:hypothetical protein COU14_01550 [Candidatus Kaiserbacteria bacterium CG10_big_fil_rev_8_21_14_0_10_44_10]|uniref:Type II toxin-antitoxin system mRNA interferase toxin, RelE/StbE family n=1 Tax=Candidatus Kaiserbacteria bacterium CG10_big_fil_rev_8_21_14_0_10_44_10 TaxID=1974606 RepID=A0A2H0UHR7_9BACT|nr:MAG: hypothetical protein COU14_01550 [Candidatus Kaiserbacteria bacterium CG10_big_fil_rev_8_21_14_0_10_44_10]